MKSLAYLTAAVLAVAAFAVISVHMAPDLAHIAAIVGDGHLPAAMLASAFTPMALERKDGPEVSAELKPVFDLVTAHHAEVVKLTAELDEMKASVNKLETRAGRLLGGGGDRDQDRTERSAAHKSFFEFVRRGREALAPEEVKGLSVDVSTQGGYLAPPEFVKEIIKNVVQFSPVRQAARIMPTSAAGVVLPRRTGAMTANWVSETNDRSSTEPSYGQIEIPAYEAACYVDVSTKLLEDSAFDLETELAMDFAEEFGRIEGAAFVGGNGVNKPLGFMTSGEVGSVNSGTAATIADASGQANGLIDLFYSLPAFYRARAVWMMAGTTLASARKLKDGQNGYIWQPALTLGQPGTILGCPVIEAVDMPAEGAGLFPIVFGDFQSAYRIVDRVTLSILRDPFSLATKGQVRFHARRRVGGDVVKAEAIKKLKCST